MGFSSNLLSSLSWILLPAVVLSQCLPSAPEIETFLTGNTDGAPEGSCCQAHICGLACPAGVPEPGRGFGIAIGLAIAVSFIVGVLTIFIVKGKAENFFVAGRSLPMWIVTITLGAQSIDANGILGNADLSYKYHFYDGAVLPIGLGFSLILNGIFSSNLVTDDVLTLPDVFAKRYGLTVEILVSLATIISFLCLLAGNLVGMGNILAYVYQIESGAAIWTSAAIVWAYTATGGLFSVAYTDVLQGFIGWLGIMGVAFYLLDNEDPLAPPPSIGFPGYVYPDDQTCAMYDGIPCGNVTGACCYNADRWCPDDDNCVLDNGAYPFGDKQIFPNQLTDPYALTPFPNALFWDWATIFILAFGNMAALDFQARCMAAKTPSTARYACLLAGCLTFLVGIPFSYLGSITRVHYGPDSAQAEFAADTCSPILGLPTCAAWVPDPDAFIKFLTHEPVPVFLGGWALIGIVAASMSTSDGAILAMGTVFAHNIMRQLDHFIPGIVTDENLLRMARLSTIPFSLISTLIAAYYRSSHSAGATGYLLIVAFDIVLATVVVPLFGCFYAKKPSARAALLAVISGGLVRVILEFALPKDGFLLLPFSQDEFLDYGTAASANFPVFFDQPGDLLWDSTVDTCEQRRFEDYTGVDSLAAFVTSIVVFLLIQFVENAKGGPLFSFPGDQAYDKMKDSAKELEVEEVVEEEPAAEKVEAEELASDPVKEVDA